MKRLALLCCLLLLTGSHNCDQHLVDEVVGLPAEVKEGDLLPPLTVPGAFDRVRLELREGSAKGAPFPLSGTTYKQEVEGVLAFGEAAVFDDLIIPSTGTFVVFAKVSDGRNGDATSPGTVTVTTRNFAEVTCQEDGSIIGAASTQSPLPTIIGEGACKLTKGGGDPVPANFGTLRCDFLGVSASCTAPSGNCFNRGPMVPLPIGTSVSASWSGGTVPAGSATAVRPEAIDAGQPQLLQPRSQPLRLTFAGGSTGTVRLTVMQQTNSTVFIDCLVPASAGVVEAPAALLSLMQPGPANVILAIDGRARIPSAEFATTLVVPGPVPNGFLNAVPITLQ